MTFATGNDRRCLSVDDEECAAAVEHVTELGALTKFAEDRAANGTGVRCGVDEVRCLTQKFVCGGLGVGQRVLGRVPRLTGDEVRQIHDEYNGRSTAGNWQVEDVMVYVDVLFVIQVLLRECGQGMLLEPR